jgi:hypothetical protein
MEFVHIFLNMFLLMHILTIYNILSGTNEGVLLGPYSQGLILELNAKNWNQIQKIGRKLV